MSCKDNNLGEEYSAGFAAPKRKRLRDPAYLKSFRDAACIVCGARDGTVVGAHIRTGHEGGMGLKPDDDLTLPLCYRCHMDQHDNPTPEWWLEKVVKAIARRRYRTWRRDRRERA